MPYFVTIYNRHKCQKITFFDIYDCYKMGSVLAGAWLGIPPPPAKSCK